MFSGIVENCYPVKSIAPKDVSENTGIKTFSIDIPRELTPRLCVGSSVAINGVCLTVIEILPSTSLVKLTFDVIPETLKITNLNGLKIDDLVNVELSLSAESEISGHIVSGHVDDVVTVLNLEVLDSGEYTLKLKTAPDLLKYIFRKGYVALNGCSLTVGAINRAEGFFTVHLIPETLSRTNLKTATIGDKLNLEVDRKTQAIVDTINDFLITLKEKSINPLNSELELSELLGPIIEKIHNS